MKVLEPKIRQYYKSSNLKIKVTYACGKKKNNMLGSAKIKLI